MKNNTVHYRYAIGILLATIIGILALTYFNIPDLIDKFSFALTLSSLLLAVLAIFYSIMSSQKQDNQYEKLIETNQNINFASTDLKGITNDLRRMVTDIPQHFDNTNKKIENLEEVFAKPNNEILETNSSDNDQAKNGGIYKIDAVKLKELVGNLSFNGMGVLYVFMTSAFHSRTIDSEMIDDIGLNNSDYVVGFLSGFRMTELIDFKFHKGCIIPIKCDDVLYDNYRGFLEKVVKVVSSSNGERLESIMDKIDDIVSAK